MQALLEWLGQVAISYITHFGLFGVFLGMMLESACIPLPSEIIMPFAGFLATQGQLPFWGVVIAGVLGNLVGSILAFEIGKRGGRILLLRYGRFILFSPKHLATAESWFDRHGESTVFFGRVLPVIRTFISLPAGIAKMNRGKFLLYTFLGCLPWCFLFTLVGYKLGQHWEEVRTRLHSLDYLVAALVMIGLIWFLIRNRKRRTA